MNENEIIDVEVSEVIETIPMEEETTYTDEQIDEMLVKLKRILSSDGYTLDAFEIAKKIAINSKDYLDNDTYLWVFYTYALKYEQEDNKNARRYCFIRMKDVLNASNNKKKKPKALTFVPVTLDNSVIELSYEQCQFMEDTLSRISKQYLIMQCCLVLVFFSVIKFVLLYSWLYSICFSGGLFLLNLFMTSNNIRKKYIKNQTDASKSYVSDEELTTFDFPVSIS